MNTRTRDGICEVNFAAWNFCFDELGREHSANIQSNRFLFSGILQSTVLRQHCEQCVLRNKPVEYQNVLFVCQL